MSPRELAYDGGTLVVPTGWRHEQDVDPFLVLLVHDRAGDGFVANLNLIREVVDGTHAGVGEHLTSLASSLVDHHLIDLEERPVGGGAAGVRIVSLHTTGGEGLVTEQWLTDGGASRSVLSATCLATEYDAYADAFAAMAASWRADDTAPR